MSALRATLALCLAAMALASCGSDDDQATEPAAAPPAELSAAERARFDRGIRAVQGYCRRWAQLLLRDRTIPNAARARGFDGADLLLEVLRAKPRAPIGRSADVRLRVGDVAESVEGANCDPGLEQHLDEGIAAALGVAP